MIRKTQALKNFKITVLFFTMLFIFYFLIQNSSLIINPMNTSSQPFSGYINASVTYEFGTWPPRENETIDDNIFIMNDANVTLVNCTVLGSIYIFNEGILHLLQNSNITENIVISDSSKLYIDNSTVGGRIECRDTSYLDLSDSYSPTTVIWKFHSANLTITNCSIFQFDEFVGTAGQIQIIDSQINTATLSGFSTSRTYINNSNILYLNDYAFPFNIITGPLSFNFLTMNFSYQTSKRAINLTWNGWDSPIIDGFLNITFQILLDNQPYAEINGSGFFNQYSGNLRINFSTTGFHNITVISIDSSGNKYNSTISVEIIEYPSFPWLIFLLTVALIVGLIAIAAVYLRYKQSRGYYSSLGTIFKKELAENKIKIIIFVVIAAVPGIILYFIFSMLNRLGGDPLTIDNIRSLVYMVFTIFLNYFGLVFSIIFASSTVVKARRRGSLSWFLSKPVRRWEFLWGKIFAYFLIIILIMAFTSVSLVLSSIKFIDPIYIPDILSMSGFIFLIGLIGLIPLTSIVILCSSVVKKTGLSIFIPIMLLMIIPPIVNFLPILTKNELPLLLSFTYYFETMGNYWIFSGPGLFGSIGMTYGEMFDVSITPLNLNPIHVILILSSIAIICLAIATYYLEKTDIA